MSPNTSNAKRLRSCVKYALRACLRFLLLLLLLLLLLYLHCTVSVIGIVAVDSAHK
jgi:hypothetical protein